jgi:hypothetical protein
MPATIAEPIRGAFRRVRDVVNGKTFQSRLDAAITEIDAAAQKSQESFESNRTFENEREMIISQMVAAEARRRVQPMQSAKLRGYLIGMEWAEFSRQYPEWREALRTACQVKLEAAKKEFDKIESEIAPQLREQGFDAEQIANHPQIKRASNEVSRWEGAPARCIEEKDGEKLWGSLVNRFCCQEQ